MDARRLWKSPAVLLVVFAVLVAMTGIVYTHWFTQATVQGNVDTGGVHVSWWSAGTNDDGDIGNDYSLNDDGGGTNFDGNGPGSSDDPRRPYPSDVRYDKDVGSCWVEHFDGDHLGFQIQNGYPSYHCTVQGSLVSDDSVPVKSIGMVIDPNDFFRSAGWDPEWDGPVCWSDAGTPENDDDFSYAETDPSFQGDCEGGSTFDGDDFVVTEVQEPLFVRVVDDTHLEVYEIGESGRELALTAWIAGDYCGAQADPVVDNQPNGTAEYFVTVHVEQDADQHSNYHLAVHPQFVNWNEFSRELCTTTVLDVQPG